MKDLNLIFDSVCTDLKSMFSYSGELIVCFKRSRGFKNNYEVYGTQNEADFGNVYIIEDNTVASYGKSKLAVVFLYDLIPSSYNGEYIQIQSVLCGDYRSHDQFETLHLLQDITKYLSEKLATSNKHEFLLGLERCLRNKQYLSGLKQIINDKVNRDWYYCVYDHILL